jgi:hypothetical protein
MEGNWSGGRSCVLPLTAELLMLPYYLVFVWHASQGFHLSITGTLSYIARNIAQMSIYLFIYCYTRIIGHEE